MKTKLANSRFSYAMLAAIGFAFLGCHRNFSMVDGYAFTKTGETAEWTEEGKFSEGITAIDVVNKFGNVKIELAVGEPGWKWQSKVWADSQELADQLIDELAMDVQTNEKTQTWQVVLPEPTSDLNGIESNLTLMVPADVKAKLDNAHGDVTLTQIYANVEVTNRHGNVDLIELRGIVNVENAHGDLMANQIGEATIDISHGAADVSMSGNLSIFSSHGDIEVENIAGELTIDAEHTNIKVDQVDSHGDLKTSHGDIIATNLVGDVKVRNSHGLTRISTSGENVTIKAAHGRVELSMVSSSFNSIDIETSHESVRVELPANTNLKIDMQSSHGKTSSEFGSSASSQQMVKLRTSHGDIRVTKNAQF
jgi:hypothetical protein